MKLNGWKAGAGILGACAQLAGGVALADDGRFYGRLFTGINGIGTDTLTLTDNGATATADAEFDPSFTGGGAAGYRFDDRWRIEADVVYRSTEVESIRFEGGQTFSDGNFASLSIAVTGIYDFDAFGAGRNFRPYLGLGLVYLQEVDVDFEDSSGELSFSSDDVALSALAGIRYESGQRWFVDAELRYFDLNDIDLDGEGGATGTVTADYDPWALTLGIGWTFDGR